MQFFSSKNANLTINFKLMYDTDRILASIRLTDSYSHYVISLHQLLLIFLFVAKCSRHVFLECIVAYKFEVTKPDSC